jgi:hypothetical protein
MSSAQQGTLIQPVHQAVLRRTHGQATHGTWCETLGFVMDSVSANRSALSLLQHAFPELVNLTCISHTRALLMEALEKHLAGFRQRTKQQWRSPTHKQRKPLNTCCSSPCLCSLARQSSRLHCIQSRRRACGTLCTVMHCLRSAASQRDGCQRRL